MKLNFETEKAREAAKRLIAKSKEGYYENNQVHQPVDAFMLLINGTSREKLDNLCAKLEEIYPQLKNIPNGAYEVTQGNFGILSNVPPSTIKMVIYSCAIECLKDINENEKNDPQKGHLGTGLTDDGRFNTSSWISHSLYEAEAAERLAKILGVDSNKAKTLALLHDYGRSKGVHSFKHVPRGFEELVELGWEDEAVASLTHSFINGGRCANCDPAEEGFYLDEEGNARWESEDNKDDVARFLDGYVYSVYDEILNIADLMATDRGIVSPSKRVEDIRTRKPADTKNEGYFLAELTNKLSEFLNRMGVKNEIPEINSTNDITQLRETFNKVSEIFNSIYREKEQSQR